MGFLKVKLDFQWSSLDAPLTHGGNFKNYQKHFCHEKLLFTMFNPVNYQQTW